MQKGGFRLSRDAVLRYVTAALVVYGAVGVAVHLRLVSLIVEGVRGWVGLRPPLGAPLNLPWLEPLHAHFDSRPWLPWAAWLVAVGLLAWLPKLKVEDSSVSPGVTVNESVGSSWLCVNILWVTLCILLALTLLGGYARMNQLWPQSVGISQNPYDDEGVYVGASQLFLQGIFPYRDYFFAHPPIAALSYAPALAYHFNEWGSPTSFMMARYLSVAYSLLTLATLFFIGKRLAGLWGGTLVGLLWALDGRVVEINRKVMLDGPMVLLSCAALLLYLRVRDQDQTQNSKLKTQNYALIGAVAALSALTKIAGVACLLAIVADMVWLWVESRRGIGARFIAPSSPENALSPGDTVDESGRELGHKPGRNLSRPYAPMGLRLLALLGGVAIAVIVVLGPFLVLAPSQFFRQVFFFQLLRPGDGLIDVPARIADLTSTLGNALTPLLAALGFVALSVWVWRRRDVGPWRVVILWTFLSLLLFTYSRSFYGHYYIQLAAPLCLLGAGVSLIPGLVRDAPPNASLVWQRMARYIPIGLLAIVAFVAVPLMATAWAGVTARREYRIFEIVARYANDAVPPGTTVLSTDEQFNFLAARPPSRSATGYLVDSYGHMIYLGLGLNQRDWGDLWGDVFGGKRSDDAYAAMQRPAPQADILDRALNSPLVVIHNKGFARLTEATLAAIEAHARVVEEQRDYKIYRYP